MQSNTLEVYNSEDFAVMTMALKGSNFEYEVTSYPRHGYVVVEFDIKPVSNPIQQGFEIKAVFNTIKSLIETDSKLKDEYHQLIAASDIYFNIEVPENDFIDGVKYEPEDDVYPENMELDADGKPIEK